MKAALCSITALLVLMSAPFVFAGPEAIEAKDSKVIPQEVAPEQICRWTGFYIGAHGGYSWGDLSFVERNETDPPYLFDQDGVFGGGQAGFNLQIGSWFVLGVEGTFAGGDFSDSADIFPGGEHSRGHVDSNWVGTVAGRAGLSFWKNRVLVYARGGVAFADFDYHTEEVQATGERFDADETRTGGLVGGGVEFALTCHWSVKLEYNHLFFGSEDVTGTERTGGGAGVDRTFGADVDRDMVAAGLNFKF